MNTGKLRRLDYLPALYLHIPFCSTKCSYCDFFSLPGVASELQFQVLKKTVKQAETLLREIAPEKTDTFYVGGGTPNSLPPAGFTYLLQALSGFAEVLSPGEWTVELNPEHLTVSQLGQLHSAGVTRLSVGIQSFSPSVLRLFGRNASREENLNALSLLKEYWTGDLNLDLITAVPGQDNARALEDLETALGFAPDHISLYNLTFEEGTKLSRSMEQGKIRPREEEDAAELLLLLWERLAEEGYEHYEVSNFAKTGHRSRHNLHYWQMDPYAGAGPGSVSTLPANEGDAEEGFPVRLETTRDLEVFLRRFSPGEETITPEQFLLEYLMMGLRTRPGLSLQRFRRIFGHGVRELLQGTLLRYGGLLELQGGGGEEEFLGPTEQGMLLLDSILADAAVEIGDIRPELRWP